MLSASENKIDAAEKCLENLDADDHEILIAIYGSDASDDEKQSFRRMAMRRFPSLELYEIDGEQKVYDFILILE